MGVFGLQMPVGDSRRLKITATWPKTVPEYSAVEGAPYVLSTMTKAWFTLKNSPENDDSQAVVSKATDKTGSDDITIAGGSNIAYVDIVPADTAAFANISRRKKLYGDFQVKTAAGEIWTLATGEIDLMPQVTQGTT